jgi:glycosyltransferase involved in cell wall biosynthesis
VGGVPDLVQHGSTGWLVGPGDVEGIAAQVAALLNSAPLRHAMGRRARELAESRFSLAHSADATAALLRQLATVS